MFFIFNDFGQIMILILFECSLSHSENMQYTMCYIVQNIPYTDATEKIKL